MANSKNLETISQHVETAIADCSKQDYRTFNQIMHNLNKCLSTIEYDHTVKCLTDKASQLSSEMCTKILESFPNCSVWMGYASPVPHSIINLHVTLYTHNLNLFEDVCDVFVELVHSRNSVVTFSIHMNLISYFFASLSQHAIHSIDTIIQSTVRKMPNWRKSTFDVISSSACLLSLLSSPNCGKILTNAQKCTILSAIFELIIELELNADSLADEHLSTAFKNQTFADSIPPLNDYPSVNQNSNLILESLKKDDNNFRTKLELLAWLFMCHIKLICQSSRSNSSLDWDLLCTIFRRLRDLFALHVIPTTTKPNIFPFICFQVCSLRSGLTISFAELLLSVVKDEHRDMGSRITGLSYLVSLVVRANYCLLELAVELMHEMATWCVDYTYRNRSVIIVPHRNMLQSEHKIYYAMCNAVFYLLVQLHAPLLDNSHYYKRCQYLPLTQITLSPFKPLLNTPEPLRLAFQEIMSTYHLGYSITGLDHVLISKVGSDTNQNHVWDREFLQSLSASDIFSLPFSSYKLSFTKKFIDPLIRPLTIGNKLQETNPEKDAPVSSLRKSLKRRVKSSLDLGVDVTKFARIIEDV